MKKRIMASREYRPALSACRPARIEMEPSLTGSQELAAHFRELFEKEEQKSHQEIMMVLAMTTKLRPIKHLRAFVGTSTGCDTSPVPIFKFLIENNAAQFAVAHNHPSGDPEPSESDIRITVRLKEAGELMDIPLIDHLILGKGMVYNSIRGLGYFDDPF